MESIQILRRLFPRKEPEPQSLPTYIKNLYLLGMMTATYGTAPAPETTVIHRSLVSSIDPTQGFETYLYFLKQPNEIYTVQNSDYPYLVLTKKGWPQAPRLFLGSHFPSKPIQLTLNADGLTHLQIAKLPWTQEVLDEVSQFTSPVETFEDINGLTRRRQYTFDCESFLNINAEPDGWCPRALIFLARFTNDAITDFSRTYPQLAASSLISSS